MRPLNGGFKVKLYFITSHVNEDKLKSISEGVIFSFVPVDFNLKVPLCINDFPKIEFRNLKNGSKKLSIYQGDRIRKLF